MAAVFLGVLLVLEVATLLGKSDEVREDHAAEAHMEKRIDRVGLDVLGVVVVQALLHCLLHVIEGQHRLYVAGQFRHLQPLDLVVESLRHFCGLTERDRERMGNPNPRNERRFERRDEGFEEETRR